MVNNTSIQLETTTLLIKNLITATNITIDNEQNQTQKITPSEIALSTLCSLSIVINVCVITVLLIGPRAFRQSPFCFIANIACSDLLTETAILCNFHASASSQWKEQAIIKSLIIVGLGVSICSLMFSTSDRLSKICYKGKYYKLLTDKSSAAAIIASWWIILGVFLMGPLLGWTCADLCICSSNWCQCDEQLCSQSLTPFTKSYIVFGVIYFNTSFLLMFYIYFLIYLDVRKVLGTKFGGKTLGQVPIYGPFVMVHLKREIQLAKTLFYVTITFFICSIPITVLITADIFGGEKEDLEYWLAFSLIPVVCHPLICSLIYYFRLPRMWSTFKHLAFATWRRIHCHKWICNNLENKFISKSSQVEQQNEVNFSANDQKCCFPKFKSHDVPSSFEVSVVETDQSSSGVDIFSKVRSHSVDLSGHSNVHPTTLTHAANIQETGHLKSFNRRLSNRNILLSNGRLIPRDFVQISSPFNAEIKITW